MHKLVVQKTQGKGINKTVVTVELIIKKPVTERIAQDVETIHGTTIHIFDTVPQMRDIPDNKIWWNQPKYSFN